MTTNAIDLISKGVGETFDVFASFTNDNPSISYTVSSFALTSVDQDGNDTTSTICDSVNSAESGNQVAVRLKEGGTVGDRHTVTCKAIMSDTPATKLEKKFIVEIV